MAKKVVDSVRSGLQRLPYMIALVGIPGGGKSVSAFMLANLLEENGISTMVMPHDGYHWPLDYLRTFPDAQDVIYRRGAPDTFDPHSLLRDLKRIRDGNEDLIKLPAFDHARADPEPDTHVFDRHRQQVVLCEGLYLLHNSDGWEEIADMFDLRIFMNSDIDQCMERVKIRNQCIPGYTVEEIIERVDKVDRINALTVLSSKVRADVIVDAIKRE
jgi:pantothenate kinase